MAIIAMKSRHSVHSISTVPPNNFNVLIMFALILNMSATETMIVLIILMKKTVIYLFVTLVSVLSSVM